MTARPSATIGVLLLLINVYHSSQILLSHKGRENGDKGIARMKASSRQDTHNLILDQDSTSTRRTTWVIRIHLEAHIHTS